MFFNVTVTLKKICYLKQNPVILTKSSIGTYFLPCLSKAFLKAFKPASWGMLGNNYTASVVTKLSFSGMVLSFFILFIKSSESLICDLPLLMHDRFQIIWKKPESFLSRTSVIINYQPLSQNLKEVKSYKFIFVCTCSTNIYRVNIWHVSFSKSLPNVDFTFSSISLPIIVNNSLTIDLQILTAMEPFILSISLLRTFFWYLYSTKHKIKRVENLLHDTRW